MHIAQIKRIGGSMMVTLPRHIVRDLNWDVGTKVILQIEEGRLVVRRHDRVDLTVEDLLLLLRDKGLLDRVADQIPADVLTALPAPHRLTFASKDLSR